MTTHVFTHPDPHGSSNFVVSTVDVGSVECETFKNHDAVLVAAVNANRQNARDAGCEGVPGDCEAWS